MKSTLSRAIVQLMKFEEGLKKLEKSKPELTRWCTVFQQDAREVRLMMGNIRERFDEVITGKRK